MVFRGFVSNRNKKIKVKMNKPVYLGLSIVETSKTMMYKFWYDYAKPKYQNNAKVFYMDTGSFTIHIKSGDIYEDIADDVQKRFNSSTYAADRPLLTGKNKKVIGLMKDELGGKIMTEFVTLRPKTYSHTMDDGKKAKEAIKCVIKQRLKFNDYKNCLLNNEIISRSQQKFKSEADNVYAVEINKIALSSNDGKRLQTLDRITPYPYGYQHWESMQNCYNINIG